MEWNKKKIRAILKDPIEVMPSDVFDGISTGEISIEEAWNLLIEAIQMAKAEIDYLAYRTEHEDDWLVFASSLLRFRKERLEMLIASQSELKNNYPEIASIENFETAQKKPDQASETLGRIIWKGKKSDFARVYAAIGRLMDCSKTEWERHFMDSKGGSMAKATDDHKGGKTNSQEVLALKSISREMNPDD